VLVRNLEKDSLANWILKKKKQEKPKAEEGNRGIEAELDQRRLCVTESP